MKHIWLSIDWDFFQEERIEWDWSHKEGGPIYSQVVWPGRAFHRGDDIRTLTSPEAHDPRASTFWSRFGGVHFEEGAQLGIADSHAAGLPFFWQAQKDAPVPDEIWNFDAHHDLGYVSLSKLREWAKEGKAEAGSWLYSLLKQRELRRVRCVHVYPNWKDRSVEARTWLADKQLAKRVRQIQARNFAWNRFTDVTIDAIFIAKSEAWSPPWNDLEFNRFVFDAVERFGLEPATYGQTNALERRPWDNAEAEAYHRQVAEFRARSQP